MQGHIISYKIQRTAVLSSFEKELLHYIASYSQQCRPPSVKLIGQHLGKCERHVRRVIKELTVKGLVIKKYTFFKRLILTVVSKEQQEKWLFNRSSVLVETFSQQWKNLKRLRKTGPRPDRLSVSDPISEAKENLGNLQPINKGNAFFGTPSQYEVRDAFGRLDYNQTARRQIEALKARNASLQS